MRFVATEAGFEDGVGGASSSAHHVLFGKQVDPQHASNSGVYFEWDDEENGAVDQVRSVSITPGEVVFTLAGRKTIAVRSGVSAREWARFVRGVRDVFASPDKRAARRPR